MAPTILIIGATGNTGKSVVETLPSLLKSSKALSSHRILALTRSAEGSVAQHLASLPDVEVAEKNWVTITADWLREQEVVRVFIASAVDAKQFSFESNFHFEALTAGVEYVVRISTTAANVRPDCPAYYPRTHWAIEQLLESPAYEKMHWSSLQPNVFSQFYLSPVAAFIKEYRKTGKQDTLKLMASADAPVGIVDRYDVGVFAAHLLVEEDTSSHNKARYVLNGPEDITGDQIVEMVEKEIGAKLESVSFKDLSFVDFMVAQSPADEKNLVETLKHAPETALEGKCMSSTTSQRVLELAAPKRTPAEVLKSLLV